MKQMKTLPNQPDRIALDPTQLFNDILAAHAEIVRQGAQRAQAEEQERRQRHQQVLGSLDDIDRDRLAEWRRDDREADDAERAE